MIGKLLVFILPWPLRRWCLQRWFGYQIHPTARIGYSWIYPRKLIMGERARIGHFNMAIHLELMQLDVHTSIARGNWITGFPKQQEAVHFAHQPDRHPALYMGAHSAITKNHHIDCTNTITIGRFTTIAGYQSQLLTHAIDVYANRQHSEQITIGDYCFVSTNVVVLGGAALPAYSVLGAKALLNKAFTQERMLYGGVPAKAIQPIPDDAAYFRRSRGFVD
nr:acyltransferase [uncultured Arsenicibacter sp.]